jgi:outer membrane protein assembly factor BamB
VVSGNYLYVGSEDGNLYSIAAASGHECWRCPVGGMFRVASPIAEGLLYTIKSDRTTISAIDALTWEQRWSFAGFNRAGGGNPRPLGVTSGEVLGGAEYSSLACLDGETGEVRWQADRGYGVGAQPLVMADRVVTGFEGYVPERKHYGCTVYGFDRASGEERWHLPTDHWRCPDLLVSHHVVCVVSSDGTIYAVDSTTGTELWRARVAGEIEEMLPGDTIPVILAVEPTIFDGIVYVARDDEGLVGFDVETGREVWSVECDQAVGCKPAVAGGTLFVGSRSGIVSAFNTSDPDASGS